jgi:hypothetical protein
MRFILLIVINLMNHGYKALVLSRASPPLCPEAADIALVFVFVYWAVKSIERCSIRR